MRQRYPWVRIIFGTIAAIFLCAALCLVAFAFLGYRKTKPISDEASVAEPIRLQVDFSKPGEYTGTFHQTCGFACTEVLRIETDAPFPSIEQARRAMDGIAGIVQITDAGGTSVYERQFTSKDFLSIPADGANNGFYPRLRFGPFKTGTHNFQLTVTQGAPALAGVGHVLVARYILCGVEFMWLIPVALGSLLCFVIASVILLAIILVTRRKRKKHFNNDIQPTS